MLRCALIVAGLMALGLPARADWTAAADNTGNVVNAHTRATDGRAILYVTCNRTMGPGSSATLDEYTGNALERLPDIKSGRSPSGLRNRTGPGFPVTGLFCAGRRCVGRGLSQSASGLSRRARTRDPVDSEQRSRREGSGLRS